MTAFRFVKWLLVAALCAICGEVLHGQGQNCKEVAAMAGMARAKSSSIVRTEKQKAGNSYRARVIFAARSLELRQQDKDTALALLNLIPENDEQHTTWMTMGDSLCSGESVADMKSLGRLGDHLPRDLAKAVLLVPDKLPKYVAYAPTSVQDPHSDYALQMETVCRSKHPEFLQIVNGLPLDKKKWFVTRVFNPATCHAIALPEAD